MFIIDPNKNSKSKDMKFLKWFILALGYKTQNLKMFPESLLSSFETSIRAINKDCLQSL